MKKIAVLVLTVFILAACPELKEDPYDTEDLTTVTFSGELDADAWLELLDDIARKGENVRLDLRKASYKEGNRAGGLIETSLYPFTSSGVDKSKPLGPAAEQDHYIAFDPFPAIRWGKDKIVEIILPEAAQMINHATENAVLRSRSRPEDYEDKNLEHSAFRHFTNLRSVTGSHVAHIGNYAFVDRDKLETVNFQSVGHTVFPKVDPAAAAGVSDEEYWHSRNDLEQGFRVDIGHFAFKGCTALKSVTFNSAVVIGRNAFQDCTSLESVTFPAALMIGDNAFEGCTSLTEVFFEKATQICHEAFKNASSLKKAAFNVNPLRFTSGTPAAGGELLYDSVIFFDQAFSGCTALETLDIRNAWNVVFLTGSLENIGTALNMHLFDEPVGGTKSSGHPQMPAFLGTGSRRTLTSVIIHRPVDGLKIAGPGGIGDVINGIAGITVTYPGSTP